jgi:phenylacetic acid degradation operon negative regulatory protein
MTANPRHLILTLLIAEGGPLSAQDAINACALFGIQENSVRVAITRLAAEEMLEAEGRRGVYRLGPKAVGLASDVRMWRTAESRVRKDWNGDWIAVHCGALGRTDRTALRRRDRALDMLGFRELDTRLFVRPDNLVGGVKEARNRLHKLGLEEQAIVFVAKAFDEEVEKRARSLWKDTAKERAYKKWRTRLTSWLARSKRLDLRVAAKESFMLGNDAIRHLVFDPLLPEPLADVKERKAFAAAVLEFDRAGHEIWRRLRDLRSAAAA